MKYSKLFGKSIHQELKGSKLSGHQLLVRAGFIRESTSGRYYFLPLGWRVHQKIQAIIKEEMDQTGAQEMITPVLHSLDLWQETNRTHTTGFELMKVTDRRGAQFALGGTAEEMFVDLVRNFQISYKDLPFNIYQFSTKFRDELRARGGLLRVREFMMKDAYSFHKDEQDFIHQYDLMADTYKKIFKRLGLKTYKVLADNGYIGGDYSHEIQVEHESGEGRFFVNQDNSYIAHEDVCQFDLEDQNPDENLLDFETIDQPEWVYTMEDNLKHYQLPKWRFLKNVVYKTDQGDIVIATIRGDLDVNKTKLENLIGAVGQLEDATDEDLEHIGTKNGYVHSWGHKFIKDIKTPDKKRNRLVLYVADNSLKTVKNFIGGQKEKETDSKNVNYGRDFTHEIEGDIAMAQDGFTKDGKRLTEKRGIEVGNIFQLGYHYTNLMKGAEFIDNDGKSKPYYMGCYGIGLGRTLATIAELSHDDNGLIWPSNISPFDIHLVSLEGTDESASALYESLNKNFEVLWDDRQESPGKKFADADLIGIPIRLVLSKRNPGKVEVKLRSQTQVELVEIDQLVDYLKKNKKES